MGILGDLDTLAARIGSSVATKIPKMRAGMSSGAQTTRGVGRIAMNRSRARSCQNSDLVIQA